MRKIEKLTERQVIEMRNEIVLNSLFESDYENSFIGKGKAYAFFDSCCDFLTDIAREKDNTDSTFLNYDNEENLISFFSEYKTAL